MHTDCKGSKTANNYCTHWISQHIYDEVYRDSQGRETPSVKINVKNGNYRRKDMVGMSLITSGFDF